MSSVLLVDPVRFGSEDEFTDNSFMVVDRAKTAENQRLDEEACAFTLGELHRIIGEHGIDVRVVRSKDEPNAMDRYFSRGDAVFLNNYISFHHFTDTEGKVVRRVVILYPMSPNRRGELAEAQLVQRLEAAAAEGLLTLLDLRCYEAEDRCLEGTGALVFSPDGQYVYMTRSGRTDDQILDVICSEENLSIPRENRFLFTSAVPRADGSGADVVYHTNVIMWCGRGIVAIALDLITFASEEEKIAFRRHLKRSYDVVMDLSAEEVRAFVGNTFELAARRADNSTHRFLCMSATSRDGGLTEKHLCQLEEWYGGAENVIGVVNARVERRTGGSIRCMIGAAILHGSVLPRYNEASTLAVARIAERVE